MIVAGLLAGCSSWGQTQLLQNLDFQQDRYTLLVLPDGYGAPTDGSAIGYVDDRALLERLKSEWVFAEEPPRFRSRCEDDLVLHFCRDGASVEQVTIRIRCRAICSAYGDFLYDGLHQFPATKPARKQVDHFPDLLAARHAHDSLAHLPGLIYLVAPPWQRYEGHFGLSLQDDLRSADQVQAALQAEIQKAYPGQPFEIEVGSAGGSSDQGWDYHCLITSNRALFDQFRLYPPTSGGWRAFDLELVTYWR